MFSSRHKHTSIDTVELPIELCHKQGELLVVSLRVPRVHLRAPFFIDSLDLEFSAIELGVKSPGEDELLARPAHLKHKDKRIVYTPIGSFIENYQNKTTHNRVGFIFHMSRCGSTFLTQSLSSVDRFYVLSEPTIVNALLDPALEIPPDTRKALLRASINALTLCAPLSSEWIFLKFRSWNIFFIDLILGEFPDSHWLFVHRNGLEVLSSVLRKPPGWLRSRVLYAGHFSHILHMPESDIRAMNQEKYAAVLLAAFCRIAYKFNSNKSLFVDYLDLVGKVPMIMKKLWGIELADQELLTMNSVGKLYSKDASKRIEFTPDGARKRLEASSEQARLAEELVESERSKLIHVII